MMRRVEQAPGAQRDLDEIWDYIAEDNPGAADRLIDEIRRKLEILAKTPLIGPLRPELMPGLRCFPVRRYVIYYRAIPDGIEVVRVLHGARDASAAFRRP